MAKTGNAASLREAAEKLVKYLPKFLEAIHYYGVDGYYREPYERDLKELRGRMSFLEAALAAPPEQPSNADVVNEAVKHESAELEDLVVAVKELRDGMCQHCDMRDLCVEGEDGMSTTCNAMAKIKNFIERHEKHETNDEAPF